MRTVFVSYAAEDHDYAEWIAIALTRAGFESVFAPWGGLGGQVIAGMNRALEAADRVVAVLTDDYLQSKFAMSEWDAAAHRSIEDGVERLVPVVVKALTNGPPGVGRNLIRVDFVNAADDDERRARLVRRLSGRADVPAQPPAWPGTAEGRDAVEKRLPTYPADVEDDAFWTAVRTHLAAWRSRFALRLDELRAAGAIVRAGAEWDDLTDERRRAVELTLEVAERFAEVPHESLRRCGPHGLPIHPSVLNGYAERYVLRAFPKVLDERRGRIPVIRSDYLFENAERLVEAAIRMAEFDIGRLPRGYVGPRRPRFTSELPPTQLFAGRRYPGGEAIDLFSVGGDDVIVHSDVVARGLGLSVLAARRNAHGSLDVIGHDSNHVYAWWGSSQRPNSEAPFSSHPVAAMFSQQRAFAVVWGDGGVIQQVDHDGGVEQVVTLASGQRIEHAASWSDQTAAGFVAATTEYDVCAWTHGESETRVRPSGSLWELGLVAPVDESVPEWARPHWNGHGRLSVGELDGFACVMVERCFEGGSVAQFLDVHSLEPLRRPVLIRRGVNDTCLAFGRWIVATTWHRDDEGRLASGLALWDLRSGGHEPVAEVSPMSERGDLIVPVVLDGYPDEFRTLAIFDRIVPEPPSPRFEVVVSSWPSGVTERLGATYSSIWPVADALRARSWDVVAVE